VLQEMAAEAAAREAMDVAAAAAQPRPAAVALPPQQAARAEQPGAAQLGAPGAKRKAPMAPVVPDPDSEVPASVAAAPGMPDKADGAAASSGDRIPLVDSLRRQLLEQPSVADEIETLRQERAARRKEMVAASKRLRQDQRANEFSISFGETKFSSVVLTRALHCVHACQMFFQRE